MSVESGLCDATGPMPTGAPAVIADICSDSAGAISRLRRQYGPMVAYRKGDELTVFAIGPEANYDVFSRPDIFQIGGGPPGPRGSSQRKFQQGLFGLNGTQHQDHRRLLLPALSKEAVQAQAGDMAERVGRFLDGWRPGQTIDLAAAMKDLSLSLTGKLLFGLDEVPGARDIAATFQEWLDHFISCQFEMTLPVQGLPDSYGRTMAAAQEMEAHFRRLIAVRQAELRAEDGDLLALLLKARRDGRIGDAELIGEMHTLLNASFQTTASALTWTLLLLATHPDVMAALHEELTAAPGAEGGGLLDRVIKESLRILPPVVFTSRRVTQPATLAGRLLPPGAVVVVSFYDSHHLPEVFPEPERFWPERWVGANVSPYAYLPFAAGPRMCLGAAFSLRLFQVVIPAILRRYRLAVRPGARVDRQSSLTLGVRGRLPAVVLAQDGRFQAASLTGNFHEMVHVPQAEPLRRAA